MKYSTVFSLYLCRSRFGFYCLSSSCGSHATSSALGCCLLHHDHLPGVRQRGRTTWIISVVTLNVMFRHHRLFLTPSTEPVYSLVPHQQRSHGREQVWWGVLLVLCYSQCEAMVVPYFTVIKGHIIKEASIMFPGWCTTQEQSFPALWKKSNKVSIRLAYKWNSRWHWLIYGMLWPKHTQD